MQDNQASKPPEPGDVGRGQLPDPQGPIDHGASLDLRGWLHALRPLGDAKGLITEATESPPLLTRLLDLFLLTAPEDSDPVHRIVDGVNHTLYKLAKALLGRQPEFTSEDFHFDRSPDEIDGTAAVALDRLDALDEYTEGKSVEAAPLRQLIQQTLAAENSHDDAAESLLRRSITIGGRYGLDAANLLGFLYYRRGDLDGAELMFNTVLRREPTDAYERETQAHAMNNLTGVHLGRGDIKSAILWCERSLMLKERLGLDAQSSYLNLLFFWLENGTAYGIERTRHYLRNLLLQTGGKELVAQTLQSKGYERALECFRQANLDQEFPELELPSPERPMRSLQQELHRES